MKPKIKSKEIFGAAAICMVVAFYGLFDELKTFYSLINEQ